MYFSFTIMDNPKKMLPHRAHRSTRTCPFSLLPSISQSLNGTKRGRSYAHSLRPILTRTTGSRGSYAFALQKKTYLFSVVDDHGDSGLLLFTKQETSGAFEVYVMRAWAQRMTCYETLRASAPAADAPMAHHFVKWWRNKFRNGYKKFSSKYWFNVIHTLNYLTSWWHKMPTRCRRTLWSWRIIM